MFGKFFRQQKPGRTISAAAMSKETREVKRQSKISVSPPLTLWDSPGGPQIGIRLPSFFMVAQTGGSGIPARSGSTLGEAWVTPQTLRFSGSNLSLNALPTTELAYNLGSQAVGNSKYIIAVKIVAWWIVIWEDCGGS